jgi:SAM-dependent methyltransferase
VSCCRIDYRRSSEGRGSACSHREYWDSRLDPIDWKRSIDSPDRQRWQQAYDCFLSPETAAAIDLLGPLRGTRLLELACGLGTGSAHLAQRGAGVTAIDLSPMRAAHARRGQSDGAARANTRFCAATAERLPFADLTFERVFARDVLMYADPQRVIDECHRVLIPGGRAVFVESLAGPAPLGWYRHLTSPADYRGFTRHLAWQQMCRLGPPLVRVSIRPYHLLSLTAFVALFAMRSPRLYQGVLRALQPLDHRLLRVAPRLARYAWRATALYEKPRDA